MPKVKLNQLIESVRGRIGDMILYTADGQNLIRSAPRVTAARTPAQVGNSDRFKRAGAYAKSALANPALKAAYQARCVGHQNARNLAIRDAMNPPKVESFGLDGYTGKRGQIVEVIATDDFRVVEVLVAVGDPQDDVIEEGLANLDPITGKWCYHAQAEIASGQTVSVTAIAKDTPGNSALLKQWHYLK